MHLFVTTYEHQEQRNLDEAITHLHDLDLCPPNHPSRAAALFNLATANFIECRVNDVSPDLDVPIKLYQEALRLRPRGYADHPFTLRSL